MADEIYQDIDLYNLQFEDRPGLKVTIEGTTTGDLLDLVDLAAKVPGRVDGVKLDPETRRMVETMMGYLARGLVSWNVADRDGNVLPTTVEGLRKCKLGLVMDIIKAWTEAQVDVSDDLGKDSGSGGTSPEAALPMVPLSPSPPS